MTLGFFQPNDMLMRSNVNLVIERSPEQVSAGDQLAGEAQRATITRRHNRAHLDALISNSSPASGAASWECLFSPIPADTFYLSLTILPPPIHQTRARPGQQQPETNKWQPRFLEEPRDTVVLAGQPVDLACRIEHKRGILSWLRNGIAIGTETIYEPYADNYRLPGAPEDQRAPDEPSSEPANYSLHINAATLLEDASFQCALRRKSSALDAPNQFKPIASHSARLSVLQPPRELQIQASILAEPDQVSYGRMLLFPSAPNELAANRLHHQQQEVPLDWLSPSSAEEAPDIKRIPVRHGQRIRLECRADQSKPHAEVSSQAITPETALIARQTPNLSHLGS